MTLINFFINSIQTEIIAGKDAARALILFSVRSREYRNTETVTTALQAIVQGYGGIEKIFGCEDSSIRRIYPLDNERN